MKGGDIIIEGCKHGPVPLAPLWDADANTATGIKNFLTCVTVTTNPHARMITECPLSIYHVYLCQSVFMLQAYGPPLMLSI